MKLVLRVVSSCMIQADGPEVGAASGLLVMLPTLGSSLAPVTPTLARR